MITGSEGLEYLWKIIPVKRYTAPDGVEFVLF